MSSDKSDKPDKPGQHDSTRDGQGKLQVEKLSDPKNYGSGRHSKDNPKRDK